MGIRENKLANAGRSFTLELRFRGLDTFRETYATRKEALKVEAELKQKMRAQAQMQRAANFPRSKIQSAMETFMERNVFDLILEYNERKKVKSLPKRNGKQGEGWSTHLPTVEKSLGQITVAQLTPSWAIDYVARMRGAMSTHGRPFSYSTIEKSGSTANVLMSAPAEGRRDYLDGDLKCRYSSRV